MTTSGQPSVTRIMRAAVKVGDDYYTIEETITLQPGATPAQIDQAVQTGLEIYTAQWTALQDQIGKLRSGSTPGQPVQIREPDTPASEKQRSYMDYLLKELHWTNEQLVGFAAERGRNLLTLTKREASELIDELKGVLAGAAAEQRNEPTPQQIDQACLDGSAYGPEEDNDPLGFNTPVQQRTIPIAERATQRQIRALERLVDERGIDLDRELRQRFGDRGLADLSMDEAGQLLSEWQQRPRVVRAVRST
jgi:hypothetical protein